MSSVASRIDPGDPYGLGAGPSGAEVVYILEGVRYASDHVVGAAATAAGAGLFNVIVSGIKRIRAKHQRAGTVLSVFLRLRFDDETELRLSVRDDAEALQSLSQIILPRLGGTNQLSVLTWDMTEKRWTLVREDGQWRRTSWWKRLTRG
jgi:hypothetical protein